MKDRKTVRQEGQKWHIEEHLVGVLVQWLASPTFRLNVRGVIRKTGWL